MKSLFLASLALASLAHAELPKQNVIFITLDGVRYKDIYKPESYDFLKSKNGYPLLHFQNWAKDNQSFSFGTQEAADEMEVGNTSCKSLPGYKAIFSGVFERECDNNYTCGYAKHETVVDRLMDEYQDPKQVALFSSWSQIEFATEGLRSQRAVQSIGLGPLKNFLSIEPRDARFTAYFKKIERDAHQNLPEWERARKDIYTWNLATRYIEVMKPRFTYISLLDTDEWAHEKNRTNYFHSLNRYDELLIDFIYRLRNRPDLSDYLDHTSIVITTDHGRGGNSWNFHAHGSNSMLMNGSENVFAIIVPSKTLQTQFALKRSIRKVGDKYSQLDIRPTLEKLLLLPRSLKLKGKSLIDF